jgi:acetone carboxylase gamma subunit
MQTVELDGGLAFAAPERVAQPKELRAAAQWQPVVHPIRPDLRRGADGPLGEQRPRLGHADLVRLDLLA